MQEKMKEFFAQDGSKRRIFLVIILFGVILVIASSTFIPSGTKTEKTEETDYEAYTEALEKKLADTISSIDGVGSCKVMLTLAEAGENVYAQNKEHKRDADSQSENDEYVIYNDKDGESPVLVNNYFPNIQGVAIVCTGGDNPTVREKVIQTVMSLFNISSNRVSVSKIKE